MELVTKQKVEALFSPALTGKTTYTADEILLTLQTMPAVEAIPIEWLEKWADRKCDYDTMWAGNWEHTHKYVDEIVKDWEKEDD